MTQADKKINWFESYIDQSMTFTSWRKVESKVCQILKQNLEKKLMDPVNRQIIFQILGNDFVNKYFSSYTSSPAILDNIRSEEKDRKMDEMKLFISSLLNDILQKKSSKSDPKVQSDMSSFSGDVGNLIDSDFQDQLSDSKTQKKQKGDLHEKYLIEMLAAEPEMVEHLFPILQSHITVLSDQLRLHIWPACILSKEKPKNRKNSTKVREKFIQLYTRLRNSSDANEDSSINSSVKKVYKETKCLKHLNFEENIKSSIIILNICNTYGRKFQHHYVYYTAILQHIYLKGSKMPSDQDYGTAAMMVEKVIRLCALNNDRASKIVNKLLPMLAEADKELISHMKKILSQSDQDKGDVIVNSAESRKKEVADVSYYLIKWISEAFVSIMNPNSIFFVWDQLFINKWENKIFYDIGLALLGLLKPWFMQAKNRSEINKVFLEEPSCLYLLDVRDALIHVQRKDNFLDISAKNRNIRYRKETAKPKSPVVKEVPKAISPKVLPPKPVPAPTFIPWVPYNKSAKDTNLPKSTVDLPFDLYIDSVRFVPDNATFIKITGKVINMYLGKKDKFVKFSAYPELDSYWRYPKFRLKQLVNQESLHMNPDVVIMMRVYTVEKHSKKICVLGSCLFAPFSNKHGKKATLRTGGHQIRVRHGIPDPDFTVEHMLASHMDDNPIIPGLTILLRVLPHTKDYVSPPEYETNYYRSEISKPNKSEEKLYKHYQKSKDIGMTVREVALMQSGQASASDVTTNQFIHQQLEREGFDVEEFPFQRYVNYNKEHGMFVLIDKAAGLPIFLEGRYLQCLVQVFPGEDTKMGNGKGQVTNFVTEDLELDSPQRAPDWSDKPKVAKPDYDDRAFILVSLYGLRPKFDPSSGKVFDKEGKEPRFGLQHAIAWSATTCFDKGAVLAGIHYMPLLKGRPPDDIIEKLSYLPLDYICKKFKSQVKVFDAASIEISIWDGRFTNSECPPLPVHMDLLNISSNPKKYLRASEQTSGATAGDLLRLGLTNPSEFNSYKAQIVELLNTAFKTNLDGALKNLGYSPTI